jgi:hypothetical protein
MYSYNPQIVSIIRFTECQPERNKRAHLGSRYSDLAASCTVRGSNPRRDMRFSLFQNRLYQLWEPLDLSSMDNGILSQKQSGGSMKLTTHLELQAR